MHPSDFELGMTVEDKITGIKGVATGVCSYISGCSQVLVVPRYKEDGTKVESEWIDMQRIARVGNEIVYLDNVLTPGPDKHPPKR